MYVQVNYQDQLFIKSAKQMNTEFFKSVSRILTKKQQLPKS